MSRLQDDSLSGSVPLRESRGQSPLRWSGDFGTCFEPDEAPSTPRVDPAQPGQTVKLETRGATSHAEQRLLWSKQTIFKSTIVAKLRSVKAHDLAEKLDDCHTKVTVAQCTGCRSVSKFYNRCELFYCPECQPRLARERKESVEWWTKTIPQPKHVVLTVRNVDTITKSYVQWFKACFSKLRRMKFARNWQGGFYRLEVTNEGRGWHLHLHALIDAKWIDSGQLAKKWGDIVGQDFAIVKVKDVREKSYLEEVTKYAVKGSELAGWQASDIRAFIEAFSGVRTFGVFGSLYGKRTEWREWLDSLQADGFRCKCGCDSFKFYDENEWEWHEATFDGVKGARPPPETKPTRQEWGWADASLKLAYF